MKNIYKQSIDNLKVIAALLVIMLLPANNAYSQKCDFLKEKKSVDNVTGKQLLKTDYVFATKSGLFMSGYFISFAKADDYYAIHLDYVAPDFSLKLSKGDYVMFRFVDGEILLLQVYENDHFGIQNLNTGNNYRMYHPNCLLTEEEVRKFIDKPLYTISWCATKILKGGSEESLQTAVVPDGRQVKIACSANCILNGVTEKDIIEKAFAEANKNKRIIPNGVWDF